MSDPLEAAEVRILRLQPGDEIILTVNGRRMGQHALDELRMVAEERWPGYRVTVLDSHINLKVVRTETCGA